MFMPRVLQVATVLSMAVPPSPVFAEVSVIDSWQDRVAISHFFRAVDEYLLVRRLVALWDPETMCLPETAYETANALASAPPLPREGGIFLTDVADFFTRRLNTAVRDAERAPVNRTNPPPATAMNAESPAASIEVGKPLPKAITAQTPPWLLAALPALPAELEYRLVARDLVIVEREGSIVADVLRGALPAR